MRHASHAGQRPALPRPVAVLAALAFALATTAAAAAPATFSTRIAPIFERHCVVCHGAEKQKAKLRLDSHAAILRGADGGPVLKPGDAKASELFRRITLKPDDDEVMPSDGKPHLAPADITLIEKWIAAGAPETAEFDAPPAPVAVVAPPAAPDYRPRLAQAEALARELGLKLVPRSRVPTDGLVLRTASAPTRCDDAALAKLAPLADLIVEAELARTKITDASAATIATWTNLRALDLSRTALTSAAMDPLVRLGKLEWLNLSSTRVDAAGVERLKTLPSLHRVWAFAEPPARAAAK
jgi:mono/diheme cytochrome c family protein